jgi:hypothetical protein
MGKQGIYLLYPTLHWVRTDFISRGPTHPLFVLFLSVVAQALKCREALRREEGTVENWR